MNKKVFDVLDNADDEIIERLSSFTDDDAEVKKRITEMSERKYKNLKEGLSETEKTNKDEITMSVTDKRPVRWFKPIAAVAAVAVVIAGVSRITNELDKYKGPSNDVIPAVQTETDSPAQSGESVEDTRADSGIPSEEEMKELFGNFADFYSDICGTLISNFFEEGINADGRKIYANPRDDLDDRQCVMLDNGYEYYFITDDRFSNLDEYNSYCAHYFKGTSQENNLGKKFHGVTNDTDGNASITTEECQEDHSKKFLDYLIIEVDGRLYLCYGAIECMVLDYPPEQMNNYFSERSFNVTENGFTRIRLSRGNDCIIAMAAVYVKGADNKWSLDNIDFKSLYGDEIASYGETAATISDTLCYLELCPEYTDEILSQEECEDNENLVQVPDIDESLTETEAVSMLEERGLSHVTKLVYNETVPEGHVIKTDPEKNKWCPKDSTVCVYVSGKIYSRVNLPDLIGKPVNEAKKALEDLGLSVKIEERLSKEENRDGIVIEMEPAPFTTIEIKNNTQSYSEYPDNTNANDLRNYLFFDSGLEPASPSVSTVPDEFKAPDVILYVSYGNSEQE